MTVPTLADPSLAPAGEHLLILTTLIPYGGAVATGGRGKERLAARLLEMAERQFPGLRERLEFVESGTPRTLERYTRNTGGALYGWELSPAQVGSGRLPGSHPDRRAAAGRPLDTARWRGLRRGVVGDRHGPQRARGRRRSGSRLACRR